MLRFVLAVALVAVGLVCVGQPPKRKAVDPGPAPLPQPAVGGEPAANTAALQALVDAAPAGSPVRVAFGPGEYTFGGPVRVPADKHLHLDGGGTATLTRAGTGRDLVVFTASPDRWTQGRFALRGFARVNGRLTTAKDTGIVQLSQVTVERCDFWVPSEYALDFATGYSYAPTIRDCEFHGGGIRWTVQDKAAEPHATSQLLIDRVLVANDGDHRPGPDIHLAYCQQLAVRNVVCQGSTGWYMPGADPAKTWRTTSVLIESPGPRGGRLQDIWCEHWNFGGEGRQWVDVRVHNPLVGSAGAYGSRDFVLDNVSGSFGDDWQMVAISAHPDALNVPTVEVRGGTLPRAEGPVVVRRWLTTALEGRAKAAKAPVWDWR